MKYLLFLYFNTLVCALSAQSGYIDYVNFEQKGSEVHIYYSLRPLSSGQYYEVYPKIKSKTAGTILAYSFSGDVGKVSSGGKKQIVWNVLKDVSALRGEIEVRIEADCYATVAPAEQLLSQATQYMVQGQFADAKKILEQLAQENNAEAQAKLGELHYLGLGTPIDKQKAFNYFSLAATQNNPYANARLGDMYYAGAHVSQDKDKANAYYQKAWSNAALLEKDAIYLTELAWLYGNGRGVTQNDTKALELYRKAAEQGYARAQSNLGYAYQNSEGVTQDYSQAVAWYRKAAEQGYACAQSNLGVMYENGYGVTKDYSQAVAWYRKAAEQGIARAQFNLGVMYKHGYGVTKDYSQALVWYQRAAEQGNAHAQNNLGVMYYNGEGVTKDYSQAIVWYQRAAEQGDEDAQFRLGYMHEFGQGVAQSVEKAREWYEKAAEQGHTRAKNRLKLKKLLISPLLISP